jgi:FtsP/CotA-like multicopper oxidase with cupredoxin domain
MQNNPVVFSITIISLVLVTTGSFLPYSYLHVYAKPITATTISTIAADQRQTYDTNVKKCTTNTAEVPTMAKFPTYFNCGHATFYPNGTTLRQYTMIIEENHKIPITLAEDTNKSIQFPAWTFNASIPGPTLRMTQGDKVEITVINRGTMAHSLHMHSIHPSAMDGVPIVSGDSGFIPPGHQFTYRFTAAPTGIFVYHCHMLPVSEHINRGLYGALIIDPPANQARSPMHEVVMFLSGFDLKLKDEFPRLPTAQEANLMMAGKENQTDLPDEHDNSLYAVNGMANYYMHHPIQVKLHEPVRVYVFNMLDFEENFFHLHGQVFRYYPSGIGSTPAFTNDVISLSQGDRGILETQFNYPGNYMAHAHEEQIGGRGWSSLFSVR